MERRLASDNQGQPKVRHAAQSLCSVSSFTVYIILTFILLESSSAKLETLFFVAQNAARQEGGLVASEQDRTWTITQRRFARISLDTTLNSPLDAPLDAAVDTIDAKSCLPKYAKGLLRSELQGCACACTCRGSKRRQCLQYGQ